MARVPLTITIDKGLDSGKVFRVTPMSARAGHRWATRALFAMMNAGMDIPENVAEAGMAAMSVYGIRALGAIQFEVAEPLLEELLDYVEIVPDPARPEVVRRWMDSDFEEASTIFKLQVESLKVNLDFFVNAVR